MGLGDLECCLHVKCYLPVHAQNFSTTGVCWDSERTALVPGSNSDGCARDSDRHVRHVLQPRCEEQDSLSSLKIKGR